MHAIQASEFVQVVYKLEKKGAQNFKFFGISIFDEIFFPSSLYFTFDMFFL